MKVPGVILLPVSPLACSPERLVQEARAQSTSSEQGAGKMEIGRSDTRRSTRGLAQYFTGAATITPLFDPKAPSQVGAALVAFEPGARTAWHTHPRGQRLVVTAGSGRTQVEDGPIEEIREGDVIRCPPNVRHWHGASPDSAMAHIAIQESVNGSPVTWM